MKIPEAINVISECIEEEVGNRKEYSGSIEFKINYVNGAVADVHVMPKRIYNRATDKKN